MSTNLQKRPPETIKEKRFAQVYLQTGNATEAAAQAYDTKDRVSAATIGYQNVRKLQMTDHLEKAGVTDEKLAEVIFDGLEASVITKKGEFADWRARAKFAEIALKLKGHMNDPESENQVANFYQFLLSLRQQYEVPAIHSGPTTDHQQDGGPGQVSTQPDSNEVSHDGLRTASDYSESEAARFFESDSSDVHNGLPTNTE